MLRGIASKSSSLTAILIMAVGFVCSNAQILADEVESPVGDAKHGENIYKTICIQCHSTDSETSPVGAIGLRNALKRHDEAWLSEWLASPAEFAKKDKKAKTLTESNPYGLVMPTIPAMADEKNRRDVIAFMKTLAKQ